MATVTDLEPALRTARQALRRIANFQLDPFLSDRLLDLGERKEFLTPAEHDELMALATFAQWRAVEKLEAELALRQLDAAAPDSGEAP